MTLVTETYDYIPTTVTFSGGAFAILKPNSIQVSGAKTTSIDLEGVSFDLTGTPQITINGPIEIDKNVEDIVGELETAVQDIAVDTITYSNCKCVSSSVQIQGSPETGLYLVGSITYQYEADNAFTPATVSFTGGGSADLHVQDFSVSENMVLIYSIDSDTPIALPTGPGQIQMSGVIAVDQNEDLTLEDILDQLGTSGLTITVGEETYTDCLCTGAAVQVVGEDISSARVAGTLTYSYTVDSAYTPVDVTFSGGSTANLFVQNLSIQESKSETFNLAGVEKSLLLGPGTLSMSGIVLNGTSTSILDDLQGDVIFTIGTDTYACTCTGSSVQTGGSQAYITGTLNYEYDVDRTGIDVKLPLGLSIDNIGNIFAQNVSVQEPSHQELRSVEGTTQEIKVGPGQISVSGIVVSGEASVVNALTNPDPTVLVTITMGTKTFSNCRCKGSQLQVSGQSKSATYLTGSITYEYIGTDINADIIKISVPGLSIFATQVAVSEGSVMQFEPGGDFQFVGPGSIDVSGLVISSTNPFSRMGSTFDITIGNRTYGGVRCIGSNLVMAAKDKYYTYYEGAIKYVFTTINGAYSSGQEYMHARSMTPQRRVLSDEIIDNGVPKIRYSVYRRKDIVYENRTYTMNPNADIAVSSTASNLITKGWEWDSDHKMRVLREQYFDIGAWDLEDQYDVEIGS